MSTTATEQTPATVEETLPPLGDLERMFVSNLTEKINERNSKVEILKSIGGDSVALLETLKQNATNSDNPEVAKVADNVEKLYSAWEAEEAKLVNLLKPLVDKMREDNKDQVESLTSDADALDKTIRSGIAYLKDLVGEDVVKYLPDIARRSNRATPGAGGHSDQRRVRGFDIYVNGVLATLRDGKGNERSNFAAAAKEAGVATKTLQDGFFAVAGQDVKNFPETVEFQVTNPKDNKVYNIRAVRVSAEATPQAGE